MRVEITYWALAGLLAVAGCGGNSSGGGSKNGGATSAGGQASGGAGGAAGSGGTTSTGGTTASGGTTSTGGATARGGATGTGGSSASGGRSGTGGASGGTTSSGGQTATGGAAGSSTGGTKASGGAAGTGGDTGTSTGGTKASGGATGTGGTAGTSTGGQSTGGSAGSGGGTTTGGAGGGVDGGGGSDAVPSAGCGKTRTLQDGNRTISSGGQNRQYYLKTPSNYDNKHPYRLVFTFHWFYGSINSVVNPPDADHNTDRPFYGLSDLSGDTTIFIAPQGLTDSGGAGWANPSDRDVKLTDDMLAAVSADLCIDTSRVFTTGFSYGGSMSYELACDRPDKFRAALLYDPGTLSGTSSSTCKTPIAVFLSHGVDDQTLSYSGGLGILNIFTKLNGCTAMTPPTPPTNGHTCTSFTGCSAGHPARVCNFGSGENNPYNASLKGHYPTPKDPGQTTSWVPAEAWAFITQF